MKNWCGEPDYSHLIFNVTKYAILGTNVIYHLNSNREFMEKS